MILTNKRAVSCNLTAPQLKQYEVNHMQSSKRKPAYYWEYIKQKNSDLIFIAKDWESVNFIRRLGCKHCLLCDEAASTYDLSCCWNKEVWVLYGKSEIFNAAVNLARTIQLMRARKIFIIQVNATTLREVKDDKL